METPSLDRESLDDHQANLHRSTAPAIGWAKHDPLYAGSALYTILYRETATPAKTDICAN